MRSKDQVIREYVAGKDVLDIGGTGYGHANKREDLINSAWATAKSRAIIDMADTADIKMDFNAVPLRDLGRKWELATALDVLEHLDNPTALLKWIPSDHLFLIVPNAASLLMRRIEVKFQIDHKSSYVEYTLRYLLTQAGYEIVQMEYICGKFNPIMWMINTCGSLCPSFVATGLAAYCQRTPAAG